MQPTTQTSLRALTLQPTTKENYSNKKELASGTPTTTSSKTKGILNLRKRFPIGGSNERFSQLVPATTAELIVAEREKQVLSDFLDKYLLVLEEEDRFMRKKEEEKKKTTEEPTVGGHSDCWQALDYTLTFDYIMENEGIHWDSNDHQPRTLTEFSKILRVVVREFPDIFSAVKTPRFNFVKNGYNYHLMDGDARYPKYSIRQLNKLVDKEIAMWRKRVEPPAPPAEPVLGGIADCWTHLPMVWVGKPRHLGGDLPPSRDKPMALSRVLASIAYPSDNISVLIDGKWYGMHKDFHFNKWMAFELTEKDGAYHLEFIYDKGICLRQVVEKLQQKYDSWLAEKRELEKRKQATEPEPSLGYSDLVKKISQATGIDEKTISENDSVAAKLRKYLLKVSAHSLALSKSPPILVSPDLSSQVLVRLRNTFGSMDFMPGRVDPVEHPWHAHSRLAVTRNIRSRYPTGCPLTDIGGNFSRHIADGAYHVHSCFLSDSPEDASREVKMAINVLKDLEKKTGKLERMVSNNPNTGLSEDDDVIVSPSDTASMINNLTTGEQLHWCNGGFGNCCVIPSKQLRKTNEGVEKWVDKPSFAMSIDTLFHIEPEELLQGYAKKKILHATHAITLPEDYHLRTQGTLPYNEGSWTIKDGELIMVFQGSSHVYRNKVSLIDYYLTNPIIVGRDFIVHCRVEPRKGPYVIIEHSILNCSSAQSLQLMHAMWTTPDADTVLMEVPMIDINAPVSLLRKQPFKMELTFVNLPFLEKLSTRLMSPCDWTGLMNTASSLIGYHYVSSTGVSKVWDITPYAARQHCLLAYWMNNRDLQSIQPLVKRAEETVHMEKWWKQAFNAIKNLAMDLGRAFDPSDDKLLNEFIKEHSEDNMLFQASVSSACRTVQMLQHHVVFGSQCTIIGCLNSKVDVSYGGSVLEPTKWFEDASIEHRQLVDSLFKKGPVQVPVTRCAGKAATCPHQHKGAHMHIIQALNWEIAPCGCCGILSSLNQGWCVECSQVRPCMKKKVTCKCPHTIENDECCGKALCRCVKNFTCECCGNSSMANYCDPCWQFRFGTLGSGEGPVEKKKTKTLEPNMLGPNLPTRLITTSDGKQNLAWDVPSTATRTANGHLHTCVKCGGAYTHNHPFKSLNHPQFVGDCPHCEGNTISEKAPTTTQSQTTMTPGCNPTTPEKHEHCCSNYHVAVCTNTSFTMSPHTQDEVNKLCTDCHPRSSMGHEEPVERVHRGLSYDRCHYDGTTTWSFGKATQPRIVDGRHTHKCPHCDTIYSHKHPHKPAGDHHMMGDCPRCDNNKSSRPELVMFEDLVADGEDKLSQDDKQQAVEGAHPTSIRSLVDSEVPPSLLQNNVLVEWMVEAEQVTKVGLEDLVDLSNLLNLYIELSYKHNLIPLHTLSNINQETKDKFVESAVVNPDLTLSADILPSCHFLARQLLRKGANLKLYYKADKDVEEYNGMCYAAAWNTRACVYCYTIYSGDILDNFGNALPERAKDCPKCNVQARCKRADDIHTQMYLENASSNTLSSATSFGIPMSIKKKDAERVQVKPQGTETTHRGLDQHATSTHHQDVGLANWDVIKNVCPHNHFSCGAHPGALECLDDARCAHTASFLRDTSPPAYCNCPTVKAKIDTLLQEKSTNTAIGEHGLRSLNTFSGPTEDPTEMYSEHINGWQANEKIAWSKCSGCPITSPHYAAVVCEYTCGHTFAAPTVGSCKERELLMMACIMCPTETKVDSREQNKAVKDQAHKSQMVVGPERVLELVSAESSRTPTKHAQPAKKKVSAPPAGSISLVGSSSSAELEEGTKAHSGKTTLVEGKTDVLGDATQTHSRSTHQPGSVAPPQPVTHVVGSWADEVENESPQHTVLASDPMVDMRALDKNPLDPIVVPPIFTQPVVNVSMIVTGSGSAISGGECGADACAQQLGIPIETCLSILKQLTHRTEWFDGHSLGMLFMSQGKNAVILTPFGATLYRGSESNEAKGIMTEASFAGADHWVPCTGMINILKDAHAESELIGRVRIMCMVHNIKAGRPTDKATIDSMVGNFTISDLDSCIAFYSLTDPAYLDVLSIFPGSVVDDSVVHTSETFSISSTDDQSYIKRTEDGLLLFTHPTGYGKTTRIDEIDKRGSRKLIITPNRFTCVSTAEFLSRNGKSVAARAASKWWPEDRWANKTVSPIHQAQLIYMTVDAAWSYIDNNSHHWMYKRDVYLDEIHMVTPKYLSIAKKLGSHVRGVMTATLSKHQVNITSKFPIETIITTDVENLIEHRTGEMVVCPTLDEVEGHMLHYRSKDGSLVEGAGRFTSLSRSDALSTNKGAATNAVVTGATLPRITRWIDSGKRYTVDVLVKPVYGVTVDKKGVREFTTQVPIQYEYSINELVQSRGRIGRVQPGTFYGELPGSGKPMTVEEAIMYSAYAQVPIPSRFRNQVSTLANCSFQLSDDEMEEYVEQVAHIKLLKDLASKNHTYTMEDFTEQDLINMLVSFCRNTDIKNVKPVTTKSGVRLAPRVAKMSEAYVATGVPQYRESQTIYAKEWVCKNCSKRSFTFSDLCIGCDLSIDDSYYKQICNKLHFDGTDNITKPNPLNVEGPFPGALFQKAGIIELMNGLIEQINSMVKRASNEMSDGGRVGYRDGTIMVEAGADPSTVSIKESMQGEIVLYANKDFTQLMVAKRSQALATRPHWAIYHQHNTSHVLGSISNYLRWKCPIEMSLKKLTNKITNSYVGPPGTGKTRMAEEVIGDSNYVIITLQTHMLRSRFKNKIAMSPAGAMELLRKDNTKTILIDEVELLSVFDRFIILEMAAGKIYTTGDIEQRGGIGKLTANLLVGDAAKVTTPLREKIVKCSKEYRFGKATGSLAKFPGDIQYLGRGDEGMKVYVVPTMNNKVMARCLADTKISLCYGFTNKSSNMLRHCTPNGIQVSTVGRMQGSEAQDTLFYIDKDSASLMSWADFYVGITRHKRLCTLAVEPNALSVLKYRTFIPKDIPIQEVLDISGFITYNQPERMSWTEKILLFMGTISSAWRACNHGLDPTWAAKTESEVFEPHQVDLIVSQMESWYASEFTLLDPRELEYVKRITIDYCTSPFDTLLRMKLCVENLLAGLNSNREYCASDPFEHDFANIPLSLRNIVLCRLWWGVGNQIHLPQLHVRIVSGNGVSRTHAVTLNMVDGRPTFDSHNSPVVDLGIVEIGDEERKGFMERSMAYAEKFRQWAKEIARRYLVEYPRNAMTALYKQAYKSATALWTNSARAVKKMLKDMERACSTPIIEKSTMIVSGIKRDSNSLSFAWQNNIFNKIVQKLGDEETLKQELCKARDTLERLQATMCSVENVDTSVVVDPHTQPTTTAYGVRDNLSMRDDLVKSIASLKKEIRTKELCLRKKRCVTGPLRLLLKITPNYFGDLAMLGGANIDADKMRERMGKGLESLRKMSGEPATIMPDCSLLCDLATLLCNEDKILLEHVGNDLCEEYERLYAVSEWKLMLGTLQPAQATSLAEFILCSRGIKCASTYNVVHQYSPSNDGGAANGWKTIVVPMIDVDTLAGVELQTHKPSGTILPIDSDPIYGMNITSVVWHDTRRSPISLLIRGPNKLPIPKELILPDELEKDEVAKCKLLANCMLQTTLLHLMDIGRLTVGATINAVAVKTLALFEHLGDLFKQLGLLLSDKGKTCSGFPNHYMCSVIEKLSKVVILNNHDVPTNDIAGMEEIDLNKGPAIVEEAFHWLINNLNNLPMGNVLDLNAEIIRSRLTGWSEDVGPVWLKSMLETVSTSEKKNVLSRYANKATEVFMETLKAIKSMLAGFVKRGKNYTSCVVEVALKVYKQVAEKMSIWCEAKVVEDELIDMAYMHQHYPCNCAACQLEDGMNDVFYDAVQFSGDDAPDWGKTSMVAINQTSQTKVPSVAARVLKDRIDTLLDKEIQRNEEAKLTEVLDSNVVGNIQTDEPIIWDASREMQDRFSTQGHENEMLGDYIVSRVMLSSYDPTNADYIRYAKLFATAMFGYEGAKVPTTVSWNQLLRRSRMSTSELSYWQRIKSVGTEYMPISDNCIEVKLPAVPLIRFCRLTEELLCVIVDKMPILVRSDGADKTLCFHSENAKGYERMLDKALPILNMIAGDEKDLMVKTIKKILYGVQRWVMMLKDDTVWSTKSKLLDIVHDEWELMCSPIYVASIMNSDPYIRMTLRRPKNYLYISPNVVRFAKKTDRAVLDCHTYIKVVKTNYGCKLHMYTGKLSTQIRFLEKSKKLSSLLDTFEREEDDHLFDNIGGDQTTDYFKKFGLRETVRMALGPGEEEQILQMLMNHPLIVNTGGSIESTSTGASPQRTVQSLNDEVNEVCADFRRPKLIEVHMASCTGKSTFYKAHKIQLEKLGVDCYDIDENLNWAANMTDQPMSMMALKGQYQSQYKSIIRDLQPSSYSVLFMHGFWQVDETVAASTHRLTIGVNRKDHKDLFMNKSRPWSRESHADISHNRMKYDRFVRYYDFNSQTKGLMSLLRSEASMTSMDANMECKSIQIGLNCLPFLPDPSGSEFKQSNDHLTSTSFIMPLEGRIRNATKPVRATTQSHTTVGLDPAVNRPTIHKSMEQMFNAVSSRLMGVRRYRRETLDSDEHWRLMEKWLKPEYKSATDKFKADPIRPNAQDSLSWCIKKGHKLEALVALLESNSDTGRSMDPCVARMHYKVENLMKEKVKRVEEQIGRVIVWNNQQINMALAPVINKAKNRFKSLLNESIFQYADGYDFLTLNKRLQAIPKCAHMLEMDLSKQDRQTDRPILEMESEVLLALGVESGLVEWMSQAHEGYEASTGRGLKVRRPGQRWTGGCMTALGNEIRNMLLLADVTNGKDISYVFTLGDDSLIWTNDDSWDEKTVAAIAMARHNVSVTYEMKTDTALFLQLLVGYIPGKGYSCCASWERLKERISYMEHQPYSPEHYSKMYSYLMMLGLDTDTAEVADYIGLPCFVNIGTEAEERLFLNSHCGNIEPSVAMQVKQYILSQMTHPTIGKSTHIIYEETPPYLKQKSNLDIRFNYITVVGDMAVENISANTGVAVSIPTGEGKTTLSRKYPDRFVDHDALLAPQLLEQRSLVDADTWCEHLRNVVVPSDKILLTHSEETTPKGIKNLGAHLLQEPVGTKPNIEARERLEQLGKSSYYPSYISRDKALLKLSEDRRHSKKTPKSEEMVSLLEALKELARNKSTAMLSLEDDYSAWW